MQLKGKERAAADESPDAEEEIRAKGVGALVAMVEIWMSDLWWAIICGPGENAETDD